MAVTFCRGCARPVTAGSVRCVRCNNAAKRVPKAAASRRPTRPLGCRDLLAIREADAATRDVDLAWRYGGGVATIARIRADAQTFAG